MVLVNDMISKFIQVYNNKKAQQAKLATVYQGESVDRVFNFTYLRRVPNEQ